MYSLWTPARFLSDAQLECETPDFSRFTVGMPHVVHVEISLNRGASYTKDETPFTLYSTRPSIDALGHPMWGYEASFTQASWLVSYPTNEYGAIVPPLYPAAGHPAQNGRPSEWDTYRDPFHTVGARGRMQPVELEIGDRMEPAADIEQRAHQATFHGVEGSWGDRLSFLRAHHLVRDQYRRDVVQAREQVVALKRATDNGVI